MLHPCAIISVDAIIMSLHARVYTQCGGATLQVKYAREGDADAAILDEFLIDEPQVLQVADDAEADAASMGFAEWVLHIQNDVQKFVSAQKAE